MKRILYLITFSFITVPAFAQQVNDALLLDYYQNQRYVEAYNYLKSTYTEPISDLKALSRLAYTSQKAGMLPDAEGYYQRMYNLDSTNTAVLYNLAAVNQNRGRYSKAEIYYKKIITTDTTDYKVYEQLASMRFKKLDTVAGVNYLKKANKLNPTAFDIASELADYLIELKQFEPAQKILAIALAADPENTVLLERSLEIAYGLNRWTQVIKTGEYLLSLYDDSKRLKLGIAYYRTKNYTCGLETLMAIHKDDQNENSYYFTAACYKQLKDQKAAIPYFKKAIDQNLKYAYFASNYYSEMADCYQQLGQFKKAETTFKKSLLYDQSPSLTYYAMAVFYDINLNDKKNALLYYKKYLATNSGDQNGDYNNYSKSRVAALSVH